MIHLLHNTLNIFEYCSLQQYEAEIGTVMVGDEHSCLPARRSSQDILLVGLG